jgi:hypothetical protein
MKDERLIDSDRNERFSDKHMYNNLSMNWTQMWALQQLPKIIIEYYWYW